MTPGSVAARERPVAIAAVPQRGWGSPAPSPLTPLIGRRRELAAACAMLRSGSTRLLTLTGPGGIGKTRLALEIAAELEGDFGDGVIWVPLAPLGDPDAVVSSIAAGVGVAGAAASDRLVRSLRGARLLLILDNFEHVVEAAPRVAELLEACPTLQAVVTSRSRLRIRGERVLPVPPLSLSHESGGGGQASDEAAHPSFPAPHSEAVTLFVERAQALVPDFDVGEANAAVMAEICRRLDGLPLAIELAAARVGHLPLPALLDQMDRRLPLLVGGARDLPARLQTMRDAIAWSYDLLTPDEQRLFRRLAVFEGGFTLEAAERVIGDGAWGMGGEDTVVPSPSPITHHPFPGVLDALGSLVEKSLVRYEPSTSGTPRYALLETVREFAAERLAAADETSTVRQAHATFFDAYAEREGLAELLPDGERRLDALEVERANMRAALAWWEESAQAERGLRHAAALGGFWYSRGHLREGQEWLARSLARSDEAPSLARARALVWLGLILFLRGEMRQAERRSAEGLALCRTLGDALHEAHALIALGAATLHLGNPAAGAALLGQGIAAAEAVPDPRLASLMVGKLERNLGVALGEQGELEEAARLYGEALRRFEAIDYRAGIRRALGDLAYVSLRRGDHAGALERFKAVLAQERGGPPSLAIYDALRGAAVAAASLGRNEQAARWLGATEALRERLGLDNVLGSERSAWTDAVAAARRALGEAAFADAWAAGRALPPEQAIAEVVDTPAASPTATEGRVTLSAREMDVLRLLVAGQTDRAIGAALFISPRTVEGHVSRILAKLGAPTRGAAVAVALNTGLVAPPRDAASG